METTGPEDWGERFEERRPVFLGYTEALEVLLPQLLDQAQISYVQVDGRTKERSNFVSKLRRKGQKYEDPLSEVTDLSGIRVVLYYLDDVERVGKLIEEQFAVDPENSVDKAALLDPDRFGYLSAHYVVKPSAARCDLPEWAPFASLSAEIQVRTVLQHAWGAISRKLAYASVREAPRDLQRSLNRLSALLELADDQFVDIRVAREGIEQQYDRDIEGGNLDLEIDESSLDIYLRESGVAERISGLARDAGCPSEAEKKEVFDPETVDEIARENKRRLLSLLKDLGIARIADLDELLNRLWEGIPALMATVNSAYVDSDGRPISDLAFNWLNLILLWGSREPAEKFVELGYVETLVDSVVSLYDDPEK